MVKKVLWLIADSLHKWELRPKQFFFGNTRCSQKLKDAITNTKFIHKKSCCCLVENYYFTFIKKRHILFLTSKEILQDQKSLLYQESHFI